MDSRTQMTQHGGMSTPEPTPITPPGQPSTRLTRPREGRVIAGVAAAIARRIGIDVGLVRLGFVITVFFGGFGVLAYLAAWALLPEEGEQKAPAERWFKSD